MNNALHTGFGRTFVIVIRIDRFNNDYHWGSEDSWRERAQYPDRVCHAEVSEINPSSKHTHTHIHMVHHFYTEIHLKHKIIKSFEIAKTH
jgi:hypothetical protein